MRVLAIREVIQYSSFMKRFSAFCMAILLLLPLAATPFSIHTGVGLRKSTTEKAGALYTLGGSIGSYTLAFRSLPFERDSITLGWDNKTNKSLRQDIFLHNSYSYDVGGFAALTYFIGQDVRFWKTLTISYRIGFQSGVSYSKYAKHNAWSLSPNLGLAIGIDRDSYAFNAYVTGALPEEMTWQPVPIIGIKGSFELYPHHYITLDAWEKLTNYSLDNIPPVSAYAFTISYTYKGDF